MLTRYACKLTFLTANLPYWLWHRECGPVQTCWAPASSPAGHCSQGGSRCSWTTTTRTSRDSRTRPTLHSCEHLLAGWMEGANYPPQGKLLTNDQERWSASTSASTMMCGTPSTSASWATVRGVDCGRNDDDDQGGQHNDSGWIERCWGLNWGLIGEWKRQASGNVVETVPTIHV
jgi:hypothetical protein